MGCSCHVHVKIDDCNTWDFHTLKGYYLFTSDDHYRMHKIFIKDTKAKQLSDTVTFLHRNITHSIIIHADRAIDAMTWFVRHVNGMTKKIVLAKKNGVNMKDLTILAKTAAHITAVP